MRGTLDEIVVHQGESGIIPAYAGNTPCPNECSHYRRDHPRVCGEHLRAHVSRFAGRGSSPRMRGTHNDVYEHCYYSGIIPAYAGNTSFAGFDCNGSRDHPRVCGEHMTGSGVCVPSRGSSPRMRGTRFPPQRRSPRPRIIPAYAGNTRWTSTKGHDSWDHPRVCGEHPLDINERT